jgi:hypothetical protein
VTRIWRRAEQARVPPPDLAPFAESRPIDGIHVEAPDHDAIGVVGAVRHLLNLN